MEPFPFRYTSERSIHSSSDILHTHLWFAQWISSPYIGLSFFNTTCQSNTMSLQYFIIEKTYYNICAGADLTSTQAPTCARLPASPGRELQPPDSFTSLSWKGATTPWLKATTLSTTLDHVSSIFTLDPTTSIEHNLQATFHHIFRLDPLHIFNLNHTTKLMQTTQNNRIQIAAIQQNRLVISYHRLQQTLVCIRAFTSLMSRIYALLSTQTSVYLSVYSIAHTHFLFAEAAYIRASSASK